MKNRIVTLFSSDKSVNKTNILYNNYIKELNKFINFIKNIYKITPRKWLINKKQFIFAILMFMLTVNFKGKVYARSKSGNSLGLQADSDEVKPSTAIIELEINEDDGYIRSVVENQSGLIVPSSLPKDHLQTMYKEAKKNQIPFSIFFRWIFIESTWNRKAISRDGAVGYTQLMPSTYNIYSKKLKIGKSATNNICIGAYYLKEMYDYWSNKTNNERSRWELALASYNGNIENVKRQNSVPKRSSKYVNYILNKYE